MDFEFVVDGKIKRLSLNSGTLDGFYDAVYDGRPVKFRASSFQSNSLTLILDGRVTTAHIAESDCRIFVYISGKVVELGVPKSTQDEYSKEMVEYGAQDKISAPMPGKIVKILVEIGETVKPKQPLIVLESMKMENEIKSTIDGVVKAIKFNSGDLVGPGQTIIELSRPTE
jgi:biotin carboxyl carrier protein